MSDIKKELHDAKVQKFIELASKQPITKQTWESIAFECGISRKTCYRWKDKYKVEIANSVHEEIADMIPELFKVGKDLLMSTRTTDKKAGVDVLLKLDDKFQVLQEKEELQREELRYKYIMQGMLEALNITTKEDFIECIDLVTRLVCDMMAESLEETRQQRIDAMHMTAKEMLETMTM